MPVKNDNVFLHHLTKILTKLGIHEDKVTFVSHEVGVGFPCSDRALHTKPAAEGLFMNLPTHSSLLLPSEAQASQKPIDFKTENWNSSRHLSWLQNYLSSHVAVWMQRVGTDYCGASFQR